MQKTGGKWKMVKRPLCYRGMTYEVLRWQEIIILKIQNYFAVQHWLNVMKSQIPTTLGARANKKGQPRSIKSCTRTIVYNYLSLYFSYFQIAERISIYHLYIVPDYNGFSYYLWRKRCLTSLSCLHLNIILLKLILAVSDKFNHILSVTLHNHRTNDKVHTKINKTRSE